MGLWLLATWGAGALICSLVTCLGLLSLARLERRAQPVTEPSWCRQIEQLSRELGLRRPVCLLMSAERVIPMVWGLFRIKLLLPQGATHWDSNRSRLVLLHELAHVKRRDYLAHLLARLAYALHWFNPLVWIAAWRMAVERERACDDLVLNSGSEPADYAEELLGVVAGLRCPTSIGAAAIAMAHPSKLESRLKAILDATISRRRLTRTGMSLCLLAATCLVLPLASLRPAVNAENSIEIAEVVEEPEDSSVATDGHTPARMVTEPIEAQPAHITYTGRIVGHQGHPVQEAEVCLYEMTYEVYALPHDVAVVGRTVTGADGTYTFRRPARSPSRRYGTVFARKEGLAVGWAPWDMYDDQQADIVLGEPKVLTGLVVNEQAQPIEGAEVTFALGLVGTGEGRRFINRHVAQAVFKARTDASGRFDILGLPAHGTFELLARKPGYATVSTMEPSSYDRETLTFSPGQADITLVASPEAVIAGTVVDGRTNAPVSDVTLMLLQSGNRPTWGQERIEPRQDGTFRAHALGAGTYTLRLLTSQHETAQWVTELQTIELNTGQARADMQIELGKGGLLEVVVRDAGTLDPIKEAHVSVFSEKSGQAQSRYADKDGMARVRLSPGAHTIRSVYRKGYGYLRPNQRVVIEEGLVKRQDALLRSHPKVSGVVRDTKGQPLESAIITICPDGTDSARSDAAGRFEAAWRREDRDQYVVARHQQKNLALVQPVSEDTGNLDLTLKPAVALIGDVVDHEDSGIAGARVHVTLSISNMNSSLERGRHSSELQTDANGHFEITAIPPENRYSINAMADGYGRANKQADVHDAVNDRLDLGTFVLPLADLSVTGVVIDTEGAALPNATIQSLGIGQPDRRVRTDAQGRFILEGVGAGSIELSIQANAGAKRLHGRTQTEGGAKDIEIVVSESGGRRFVRGKTYEQIVQNTHKVIAGVVLDQNNQSIARVAMKVV